MNTNVKDLEPNEEQLEVYWKYNIYDYILSVQNEI